MGNSCPFVRSEIYCLGGGGPNLIAATSFSGVSVLAKKIIKNFEEEKNDESRRDLLKSAKIIYWQPRHVFH